MPTPGRHICIPCSEKEDPEEEKRTADLASAHVIHPFPLSSNRPRGLSSSRESWTSKESGRTVRVPPARAISRAFRSLWSVLRRYFRLHNPRKCRIDWELDIGGTFTDANLVDEATGEVHTAKVPTIPGDPAEGFSEAARRLLAEQGVAAADVSRYPKTGTGPPSKLPQGARRAAAPDKTPLSASLS